MGKYKFEYRAETGEIFRQVGTVGHRNKDGTFSKTEPVFAIVEPEEINPKTNLTKEEERILDGFAEELAEKLPNPVEEYIKECRRQGVKIR